MGRLETTFWRMGFHHLKENIGRLGRWKVLSLGKMVENPLLRVIMTISRGLPCQEFHPRVMVISLMVHHQGLHLLSLALTHPRTLLQDFPLLTSTKVPHQDLLHHSALLVLSWTSLDQTILMPQETGSIIGLYHLTILDQGLMVLTEEGSMDLIHTEVVTEEDLTDPGHTEEVLMNTEGVLGQGVDLMVHGSMALHLTDSIPHKDEEVSLVNDLTVQ